MRAAHEKDGNENSNSQTPGVVLVNWKPAAQLSPDTLALNKLIATLRKYEAAEGQSNHVYVDLSTSPCVYCSTLANMLHDPANGFEEVKEFASFSVLRKKNGDHYVYVVTVPKKQKPSIHEDLKIDAWPAVLNVTNDDIEVAANPDPKSKIYWQGETGASAFKYLK